MNEQIKELAEQAGFAVYGWNENEFKKFAALVEAAARADEREACADIGDSMDSLQDGAIARAIRARGTT